MTDTLAQWRRALVLERINELCEIIKDREFTPAVDNLLLCDKIVEGAIQAWEAGEFDKADALCERLEYALNNEP